MQAALEGLFKKTFGEKADSCTPLKADGSARTLYRLESGKRTVIGVVGPDPKENDAFLGFSRHFRKQGLNVPEIYSGPGHPGWGDVGEPGRFASCPDQGIAGASSRVRNAAEAWVTLSQVRNRSQSWVSSGTISSSNRMPRSLSRSARSTVSDTWTFRSSSP